jgi:hypothetical protein
MREDDRTRLLHIIEAGESIMQFMSGRSRATLDAGRR